MTEEEEEGDGEDDTDDPVKAKTIRKKLSMSDKRGNSDGAGYYCCPVTTTTTFLHLLKQHPKTSLIASTTNTIQPKTNLLLILILSRCSSRDPFFRIFILEKVVDLMRIDF